MKKLVLAVGLAGALLLAAPGKASAHFSFSIGVPGFAFFAGPPCPLPIVYAPPAPVYYYPPPVVYAPAPVFYGGYARPGFYGRGYWKTAHGYRFPGRY